ncbi:MAG TPA: hypothetical protein VII32_01715, partial [Thermoanaerobaculia bacterium]
LSILLSVIAAFGALAQTPKVSVAGIRVIGGGLGANGSEIHAFGEQHPGTAVGLAIEVPEGNAIIDIDNHGSRLDTLTDNKGRSLLEEGRFGPFPKISEDKSAAMVEVEARGRPSAGASSITLKGNVALTMASGSKPTRIANMRLEEGRTMKVGDTTITVKTVKAGDDSTELTFALPRSFMNSIHAVRFFDSKGAAIESSRSGSGYMNEAAEVQYDVKSKVKTVAVEFDVWQNIREVKVPFNLTAGLAIGGESTSAAAPATQPARASTPARTAPSIPPGPDDGAASIDAVLSQMQSAGPAGKGKEFLAVIYPDDRGTFGQGLAMGLTFSVLANMNDQKATEKAQKEIDALFKKYKVKTPLNKEPSVIFKDTDLPAFVSEGLIYLKNHAPKGQSGADVLPIPKGKAEGVKMDGDSATASVGGKDIKFARINNKWFIRLTE